jgi:hypothetical protein
MPLSKSVQEMVTKHVTVRWLERVEGYDIEAVRDTLRAEGIEPSDSRILERLYRDYGITRGHFNYKIANKAVRAAIKAGARRINQGTWTMQIVDGVIVTLERRTGSAGKAAHWTRKRQSQQGKNCRARI